MNPEFFDIFGLAGFTIILLIGIWILKAKNKVPNWIGIILMIIAILGLIVDGFIVITNYIL